MPDADATAAELGLVIVGIGDVLYGTFRALEAAGIMDRDRLVALLDAVIADTRLVEGAATKRTLIAEMVREGLLRWDTEPPSMRERLILISGGKPPDGDPPHAAPEVHPR